jgi:PKD repeat protein
MRNVILGLFLLLICTGVTSAAYVNISPIMTNNTAPAGNVTLASSEYNVNFAAWYASNGVLTGSNRWASASTGGVRYWQINLSTSQVCTNYTLYPDTDVYNDNIKVFKFNASADGITWVTLDTQTSVVWGDANPKSFPISNTNSYQYYRFVITETQGSTPVASIGEVILYKTVASPVASFTASNTTGIYPPALPVKFTDTSTNTPTSWEWNFTNTTGNNTAVTFSTTQSPLWSFDIGNFSISLKATNADGSDLSDQVTWINVSSPTTVPAANFTANGGYTTVAGTAPLTVVFNYPQTNGSTSWSWIFGDGNTTGNTDQNPSHLYTASGTYSVNHSATNVIGIGWKNVSSMIVVTNASGFTPQDIWMQGQYLQTFHITDSTTGLPIPVVQLQDTAMQTFTTTNGTGYLTEAFGSSNVVFVSTGYNSKSISYVFDSDASWDVQLTKATAAPQQSVWYTPWQVRFRIVDYYGKPLPGTNVTANYIASTLPSTDPTWLVGAFGVNEAVAADMLNSSMAMAGVTDDNGGLSFTMFKSIQYSFLITNTTSGVASTKNIYPSDQEYVIYVRTSGQVANNNTLETRNATLPWYSVNTTHINLNMTYIDTSLCTSQLVFRVWFRDNSTEVHNTTWTGFGASKVFDNHTVAKAPIGTEYLWGYNATTVC